MNLTEKYNELKSELTFVKKQMVFEFAQYLNSHYSIILYVDNNSLFIRTDNSKYQNISLIDFFNDEFKEYHVHAGLLFELSEIIGKSKHSNYFELCTPYFLNFIDIF
jgi:hypothetical protein